MTYTVFITEPAQDDLDEAYEWLVGQTTLHAPTWHNGLIDAVLSLGLVAARCPLLPESSGPEEVRQLLYGDKRHAYRILFSIRGEKVIVLHIVHAARQS